MDKLIVAFSQLCVNALFIVASNRQGKGNGHNPALPTASGAFLFV
jgi:hypothetical protein